jgi:hypothetical protein
VEMRVIDDRVPKSALRGQRYKTKHPNVVPLTHEVAALIAAQKPVTGSDLIFTTNGKTGFSGWSKCKRRLDDALLSGLQEIAREDGRDPSRVHLSSWRLHDIRRTAKTLMARAGVRPDISERAREEMLLHVITHGVGHRGQVSGVMLLNGMTPVRDGFTTYLHMAEGATRKRCAA